MVTTATTGPEPEPEPAVASLPATTVPSVVIHPDGSRTEGTIRVVHAPGHPPSGEPIVHHCAGLTRHVR